MTFHLNPACNLQVQVPSGGTVNCLVKNSSYSPVMFFNFFNLVIILLWQFVQVVLPLFQNNEYIQSVGRCLQMMLRIDVYRLAFVAVDGISTIISVLRGRVNFQVQYQLVFCLWVLTFNPLLAEKMNKWVWYLLPDKLHAYSPFIPKTFPLKCDCPIS